MNSEATFVINYEQNYALEMAYKTLHSFKSVVNDYIDRVTGCTFAQIYFKPYTPTTITSNRLTFDCLITIEFISIEKSRVRILADYRSLEGTSSCNNIQLIAEFIKRYSNYLRKAD